MNIRKKSIKDLSHTFPYGATSISFSRIYSSDKVPCKIRTTMPFDKFPVDPSDYRTSESECPTDMVATGIVLDEDEEETTLACSPVLHEDQLDNNNCKEIRVPYVANPKADWDEIYPYEANGQCPDGWMLTGVRYSYDNPYIHIKCCARKDIDVIVRSRERIAVVLAVVVLVLLAALVWLLLNKKK